jgi:RNA polymerase sigma-70 factor (ECF subfamily)
MQSSTAARPNGSMLARIGAGDPTGWSDFYRGYRGLARHLLGSLAPGGEHLVDDVMQDCAVRLWRSVHRHRPELGSEDVFVRTLLRRSAIDLVRSRTRHVVEPGAVPLDDADEAVPDPTSRWVDAAAVRSALAQLSDAHRETLTRAFLHDQPYTQIATELDIPEATVRTRVFHGLRRLRAVIEESVEAR